MSRLEGTIINEQSKLPAGNMHSLQIGQEYPAGAVSLGKDLAYLSKQTQWNTSVK